MADSPLASANDATVSTDGSDTRNLGFGFWKCDGEMGWRQIEESFSSFFAVLFDDFTVQNFFLI